jgi:hypothetical protein
MSEKRETDNADVYQAIPRLAGAIAPFDDAQGRLRQGGRFHSVSQKISRCDFFVKQKKVPCCCRRNRLPGRARVWSSPHRVTPVSYTTYAVTDPAGNLASGRAEEPRSCSRKFGSQSQIFVNKKQKYHAAAGESDFHRVKCPVCMHTA